MVWEFVAPPTLRIPGIGGAAVTLVATPSPASMDAGLGVMGIDIRLMTPSYGATYARRPVEEGFTHSLRDFLWSAASDFTPERLDPFEDQLAGLSIRVLASTDFTVTLELEVIAHESEHGDEVDGINFETSRACLITAAEQVERLAARPNPEDSGGVTEPLLPLDLFYAPEGQRLTGIYRTGRGVGGTTDTVCVTHFLTYSDEAQGDIETSFLTSLLPFCSVAAHGLDQHRRPWVIVAQVLPIDASTAIGAPWDAVQVAREEINRAAQHLVDAAIHGESVATQPQLVNLFQSRGVERSLVVDWTVEELALAGIAELANAPLPRIASGRLTGCAFPDVDHDCPKDVFDCAFGRWQELLFSAQTDD